MMFWGFKSWWMIYFLCRYLILEISCLATLLTILISRGLPFFLIYESISCPSSSSIII